MNIPILGTGSTHFGELWEYSVVDLIETAQQKALNNASLTAQDIDMVIVANMGAERWSGQGHLGALAADLLGRNIPHTRVDAACASGGVAIMHGILAIQAGFAQRVMITGVEKMSDTQAGDINAGLMCACRHDAEYMAGATFVSLFALITQLYFQTYNIGRKELAHVSVKNHANAMNNPFAHLHKKITIADVLSSPMIAPPLSLLDCSPVSDGAASIIIGAPGTHTSPLHIVGFGQGADSMSITQRQTMTSFQASKTAANHAYAMANITPANITLAEVHDAFSMAEIIAMEDLGFCPAGTAASYVGTSPQKINISGGLKAKGHPIGATGVSQIVELVKNLPLYQQSSSSSSYGLAHNMGGIGTSVTATIVAYNPT